MPQPNPVIRAFFETSRTIRHNCATPKPDLRLKLRTVNRSITTPRETMNTKRIMTLLALSIAAVLVSGCGWNNVRQIYRSSIEKPSPQRALVVLGLIGDQYGMHPPSVKLDEY